MIEIYDLNAAEQWDDVVRSFRKYDIYYLSGYVKAFQIHGDGTPYLFYYEDSDIRAIYVFIKRSTDISGVFDSITPYGYGGFLVEPNSGYVVTSAQMQCLWNAYIAKMNELNIVDNFVRYHPVLKNAESMRMCSDVIDLGKTIAMDLSSEDIIWTNIHSKNRNMIRKAEKNGIVIKHGQGMELFDEFIKIYNATMDKDKADDYYYFKRTFYESIHNDLRDNYEMFWAEYEGKIIAMSIMLFANNQMHYHLSGSLAEYRNLAPTNLLLYKAAQWGCERGYKTFHLGGGVGSGEDNLYKFKVAFNRNSDYQFSIAKHIFNQEAYNSLVELRAANDANFNPENKFFPLYRS
jgi:hypothetical protein